MGIEARLSGDGEFKIRGNIDTRLPVIQEGLVAHYPMDDTIRPINVKMPGYAKVYATSATERPESQKKWVAFFNNNTDCTEGTHSELMSMSIEEALQYDLIVYDAFVWGVGSSTISKLKDFVDAGISCVANGNDTTTNVFVTGIIDDERAFHDIRILGDGITYTGQDIYNTGSSDLLKGITELSNGAVAEYKNTHNDLITGYRYESKNSGAIFFFDQEGDMLNAVDGIPDFIHQAFNKCYEASSNVRNEKVKFRYVRDWLHGSTANTGNHWCEVKAFDIAGVNRALNKAVTTNSATTSNIGIVTDGNTATNPYYSAGSGNFYVQIDLGALYALDNIQVWHYYSDGRTYHDTKTQVSQDGTIWYDVFDSAIGGEYQELSGGRIHKVNGHKLPIYSTSYDGLAVEDATENLYTDGDFAKKSLLDHSVRNGVWTFPDNVWAPTGLQVVKGLTTTASAYFGQDLYPQVSGEVYTFSAWCYVSPDNNSSQIRLKYEHGFSKSAHYDMSKKGTWQYLTVTSTWVGTPGTTRGRVLMYENNSHSGSTGYWYFSAVQVEKKSYSTAFTPTTREKGIHDIDFSHIKPPYTIHFRHKSSYPFDNMLSTDQSTMPMVMQLGNYHSNASVSFWCYSKALRVYAKGDTGSGWSSNTTHYSYTSANWDNVWHDYTLTLNADKRTFKVYVDGEFRGNSVSSVDMTNIPYMRFGGTSTASHMSNAIVNSISIYDRELDADECKKLAKSSYSVTTRGVNASGLDTTTVHSGLQFPLNIDLEDRNGHTQPTTDTNTRYDNTLFVGTGTTNVVTNTDLDTGWSKSYMDDIIFDEIGPPSGVDSPTVGFNRREGNSSYWYSYGDYAPQESSTLYTISIYVRTESDDFEINAYTADNNETGRKSTNRIRVPNDGKWHRLVFNPITTIANNDSDSLSFIMHYGSTSFGPRSRTWLCAPQMEKHVTATPFVDGTIGATRAHLPYSIINLKSNFTIHGWWKPTHNGDGQWKPMLTRNVPNSNDSNNRILIMPSSTATTTVRLRTWLSSGGSSELNLSPTNNIVMNDWNFFCLRRNGNNLYMTLSNTNGSSTITNTNGANLNADEVGQVWQIGQYSSTGMSDAYHRDYTFIQEALSDNEVKQLYNRRMYANENGINIQKNISTDETLK